jgi:hypothetical protein
MIVIDLDHLELIAEATISGGTLTFTYVDTLALPGYSSASAEAGAIGEHTFAGVYTSTDTYANPLLTFSTAEANATATAQTAGDVSWEQSQSFSEFSSSSTFGNITSASSYDFYAGFNYS